MFTYPEDCYRFYNKERKLQADDVVIIGIHILLVVVPIILGVIRLAVL